MFSACYTGPGSADAPGIARSPSLPNPFMSTSSRTMTPESFGLPLFFRICLKNGVTDALPTCVILLRHTRHGARFNKGDAMVEWLTRRGRVSDKQSVQLAIRRNG